MNQVGIIQNIPNPAILKAQNAFQDEQVRRSILQKQITEKELRLQVQQSYLELQQRKALKRLYERLTQLYEQYLQIANLSSYFG